LKQDLTVTHLAGRSVKEQHHVDAIIMARDLRGKPALKDAPLNVIQAQVREDVLSSATFPPKDNSVLQLIPPAHFNIPAAFA
jgi:hypothetical protein